MKLLLKNTSSGLIPIYDDDYEEKKKLKIALGLIKFGFIKNYLYLYFAIQLI